MLGVENYEKIFPHQTFRKHQRTVLEKASEAFRQGREVVLIEGPTGFGKSPVNVGVARQFDTAFYTTPQRKLVRQLASDPALEPHIEPLLGRETYDCEYCKENPNKPNYNCRDCYVRDSNTESCYEIAKETGKCTYWAQKLKVMNAPIALVTFAHLIIDSSLPPKYSFGERELLIVDECHNLEGQAASMFAGFTVSPYNLPNEVWNELDEVGEDAWLGELLPWLEDVKESCRWFSGKRKREEQCEDMIRKIRYMQRELEEGREWVVDVEYITWKNDEVLRPQFKPVKVDLFLKRKVWPKADKIILSSATIPFRDNPGRWLQRIGLGDANSKILRAPMSFPVQNRPIITTSMGGKMTREEEPANWERNVGKIKEILQCHQGEKGVIHTASYDRARRLDRELDEPTYLHKEDGEDGDVIENWKESGEDILISPAVIDGVDLKEDLCRFQILFKVPYPSTQSSRVKALLDRDEWAWYWATAMKDVVQSYGRAVRSRDDFAVFYVVDRSFKDLLERTKPPIWFKEAIDPSPEALKYEPA